MHLSQLELFRYRNLKDQTLSFPRTPIFVLGKNGQGKTNLIEAISLLSRAKSFRPAKPADFIRWDSQKGENFLAPEISQCCVRGRVAALSGEREILFSLVDGKRRIEVNRKPVVKAAKFYGQFVTVVFTCDDLDLVKGPPALRRRFIDRSLAMIDSGYMQSVIDYQQALKSRNALLVEARQLGQHERTKQLQSRLAPWTQAMYERGVEIMQARAGFIDEVGAQSAKYCESLSVVDAGENGSRERLIIEYKSDILGESGISGLEEFLHRAALNIERDLRAGASTFGIHRDELRINFQTPFGKKLAQRSASQGQARSIALSLVLSVMEVLSDHAGERPVLLLDDVESELDMGRRNALFKILSEFSGQVFVTGAEYSQAANAHLKDVVILHIDSGQVGGLETGSC